MEVRVGAGARVTSSLQLDGQVESQSLATSQLVQSDGPGPEHEAQHASQAVQPSLVPSLSYSPLEHVPSPHEVGAGGGGGEGKGGGGDEGAGGGGDAGGGGSRQVVHSSASGPVQPAPVPSPVPVQLASQAWQTSDPEVQSA